MNEVDRLLEAAEKVYRMRCTLTFDYERTERGFAPHCTLKSAAGEMLYERTEMSFSQLLAACAGQLRFKTAERKEAAAKALREAQTAHEQAMRFAEKIDEILGVERPEE